MADKPALLRRANGSSVHLVLSIEGRSQWGEKKRATHQPHGGIEWGCDLSHFTALPNSQTSKMHQNPGKKMILWGISDLNSGIWKVLCCSSGHQSSPVESLAFQPDTSQQALNRADFTPHNSHGLLKNCLHCRAASENHFTYKDRLSITLISLQMTI